jgi:hypothetical protein
VDGLARRWTAWRARWWRAALAGAVLTSALCAFGMAWAFAGPDLGETCTFGEGQHFDPAY